MLERTKKCFIPNEGNDHQPYFLRMKSTVVILSVVLFLEVLFLIQALVLAPQSGFFATILSSALVDFTNETRVAHAEFSLSTNTTLQKAAQMKADDMARRGYFSHNTPEGKEPWYFFEKAGYDFVYAGENLAVNFVDSKDVVDAWMDSKLHRENILNAGFREVGIGIASGIYNGREAVFVVQFFGTPIKPSPEIKEKAPTAVANTGTQKTGGSPSVLGEAAGNTSYISAIKKVFSSPRTMNKYLFIVFLTIVSLALILTVFIKVRIQHPPLIVNAAMILLVLGSLLVVNQYLTLSHIQIF